MCSGRRHSSHAREGGKTPNRVKGRAHDITTHATLSCSSMQTTQRAGPPPKTPRHPPGYASALVPSASRPHRPPLPSPPDRHAADPDAPKPPERRESPLKPGADPRVPSGSAVRQNVEPPPSERGAGAADPVGGPRDVDPHDGSRRERSKPAPRVPQPDPTSRDSEAARGARPPEPLSNSGVAREPGRPPRSRGAAAPVPQVDAGGSSTLSVPAAAFCCIIRRERHFMPGALLPPLPTDVPPAAPSPSEPTEELRRGRWMVEWPVLSWRL